jgi:hypothetical protein
LSEALSAFETATKERRWSQAGANPDSFYRAQVGKAIEWWKTEGRLKE